MILWSRQRFLTSTPDLALGMRRGDTPDALGTGGLDMPCDFTDGVSRYDIRIEGRKRNRTLYNRVLERSASRMIRYQKFEALPTTTTRKKNRESKSMERRVGRKWGQGYLWQQKNSPGQRTYPEITCSPDLLIPATLLPPVTTGAVTTAYHNQCRWAHRTSSDLE
jgi:hypothetical protein